jgi:GntR family transcriptional regulator
MAPSTTTSTKRLQSGTEQVRARLLTALHLGKLRPGDRVLSVRRLADMTGMNRKTVHRAYRALAHEGFLDVRPGSGTFVAEAKTGPARPLSANDLLLAVNHCRADATSLGLTPETLASFLQSYLGEGLKGLPLAVTECNREQMDLIARDLEAGLGIAPKRVLLRDLEADPRKGLEGTWGVVTTDCHRAEVAEITRSVTARMYRVALDPEFPQRMVQYAKAGPLVMVVRDISFGPVFLRLLRQMAVPPDVVARIRLVDSVEARSVLRDMNGDGAVYLSPLLDREIAARVPERTRRVDAQWGIAPGTLDRLRARLALDLATAGAGS